MINSDQKRNRSSNGDKWDLATPTSYPGILFLKWPTFDLEHGFTKSVVSIMICKVFLIFVSFEVQYFFSNWILKVENSSYYSSLMKNNERPLFWKCIFSSYNVKIIGFFNLSSFSVKSFLDNSDFWVNTTAIIKTIHLISRKFCLTENREFSFSTLCEAPCQVDLFKATDGAMLKVTPKNWRSLN